MGAKNGSEAKRRVTKSGELFEEGKKCFVPENPSSLTQPKNQATRADTKTTGAANGGVMPTDGTPDGGNPPDGREIDHYVTTKTIENTLQVEDEPQIETAEEPITKNTILPPEILLLIFEELYNQKHSQIGKVRLVSHQFEALVSPLVFRNIRLDSGLVSLFIGTSLLDLQNVVTYATKYARNVTLPSDYTMDGGGLFAITKMEDFRMLKFLFEEIEDYRPDDITVDTLRNYFSDLEICIQTSSQQMKLIYAAQGGPRAELRSITVNSNEKMVFQDFGVGEVEWNTLEHITTNGYLDLKTPTRIKKSVRTLKMNRSSDKFISRGTASSYQVNELRVWFPCLEDIELNLNVQEGEKLPSSTAAVHESESVAFVENLTHFRNLRRLTLKANPHFIEGPTYHESSVDKSSWLVDCPKMVQGRRRVAKYKARAAKAVTGIFKKLLAGKKGVPFEELSLRIEGWTLCNREQQMEKPLLGKTQWAGKCVPALSCVWQGYQNSGDPWVQVDVEECVRCQIPAIIEGLFPPTKLNRGCKSM